MTLIPESGERFSEHHETLIDRLVDVDFAKLRPVKPGKSKQLVDDPGDSKQSVVGGMDQVRQALPDIRVGRSGA